MFYVFNSIAQIEEKRKVLHELMPKRRLSQCETTGEIYEIENEIADRFGKLDTISRQFIDVMVMKVLAKEQKIAKVSNHGENLFIEFVEAGRERLVLKSPSKDDDDLIATAFGYLKEEVISSLTRV